MTSTYEKPNVPITESFGEYLKDKRVDSEISQQDLAAKLGYQSGQVVSNWERGTQSPPFNILVKIAGLLKVSDAELLKVLLSEQKRVYEKAFTTVKRKRK